ncbi:MAG TPA: phenylalanine--tRNA ligase subunit beta [Candidatus Poseidoniaceae archaeon]|nr:MAG TPA: phenylalanine--tRNA ligase subunit beta [Candidatus Poseidoniales archaeon]HII23474.1 phenylalanine--tRNA ligase subunit beta [Candidatus Poseidoniaceae archaeon]
MPTISVEQKLIEKLLKKHGHRHDIPKLAEQLPLLGTDIDRCDDEILDIEIFPNRPDLLSGETLSRAIRNFIHLQDSNPDLEIKHGEIAMAVDSELEHIRPIILGAVVRGIDLAKLDISADDFIKSLMDHQEKLHFALGRGRKRASIGVHDLSKLAPPFTVKAVSGDTKFIPLAMTEAMTINDILQQHPKGVDYAHLVEDFEKFPIIVDANDNVLSFPPIINGDHTTVTSTTKDFFIDVTGWDFRSCEASLMLIAIQLQELGGTIESVEVTNCHGMTQHYPNGSSVKHELPIKMLNGLLGSELSDEAITNAINRMGGKFISRDGDSITINMPRWRFDILHPVDLVEDIAIGHGYEDLGEDIPRSPMTAKPRDDANLLRRVRDSMQGLGMMQIQSLTLSNDDDQFNLVRLNGVGEVTRITNPITIDHTLLRQYLLPGLLRLLSTNRHHDLPQSVYEVGTVVRGHKNSSRLAFLIAERSGGFAAIRGRIQAFLRDLGATEYEISPLPENEGPWLAGRAAKVVVNGNHIGCFGEIDPHVAELFELNVPMNGAEFSLQEIAKSIPDPV